MPFRGRARGRARLQDTETTPVGPPPRLPPSEVDELLRGLSAVGVAESAAASEDAGAAAAASEDACAAAADQNRPSSREAAPEFGALAPEGGAIPKRRDQGTSSGRGSAGGRPSSYIEHTIFGGYSRDNKKDFMTYVSTDTRQKNVTYAEGETGKGWKKLDVVANSFPLASDMQDVELNQYHVSFEPVLDSTRKRINLLTDAIDDFTTAPSRRKMIFDGAVLFLPASVTLKGGRKEITQQVPNSEVRLTIKHTACLSTQSPTVKQILNRIFRDAQSATGSVQIGRHYFNHTEPTNIARYNIDIWPGFSTRIDQYDAGVMCTIDTISKVMKCRNVLEQITEYAKEADANVTATRAKAEKEIVGETVLTRYNNKNYRIDGIDWRLSPEAEFDKSDGSTISYKEYYKKNYDLDVNYNQPLLVHRPKPKEQRMRDLQKLGGPIHLIPELCHLTGLGTMRQDFNIMREVAKVTRFDPNERHEHMTRFVREMQGNPEANAELQKLGLQFTPSPVQVDGAKQIPQTQITQGDQPLRYRQEQADWSRALADSRFNDGVRLQTWQVVFPRRFEEPVRKFVSELRNIGDRVGMAVNPPEYLALDQIAGRDYISQIREISDETQMVFCVLPDDKKDRYDAIKQLLSCQNPVSSQLILSKTCGKEKILRSIATKVLLQMNCKLGGSPWDARMPFKRQGVAMIVGVDTFVDAKQASKSTTKVNGALVASYDPQATKWFSRPLLGSNETIEQGLEVSLEEALRNYKQHNGQLPERIMVYRDGVGDGQLEHVHQVEVKAYMKACRKCEPTYEPKLTVTIVTKRVPQRFFLKKGPNEFVNPPPGTVVDKTVTKHNSEMYDFYIVSQSTNQGTVSPTHYNVIHDMSGWNLDRHQMLAYKLCHLYYNWAGAIRVPAPCQYAHKLAFMVNQNLHRAPSATLNDRLWYL